MNPKLRLLLVSVVAFLAFLMIGCPRITRIRIPIGGVEMAFDYKDQAKEVVRVIECVGGDINAKDKKGRTILHYAAKYVMDPEVIMVLLDAGANPSAKDNRGNTPADYAKTNNSLHATPALALLRVVTEGRVSPALETSP